MAFKKGLIKCITGEAGGMVGATPEGMGCHSVKMTLNAGTGGGSY